jgi:tripartite-type tricarboxylate transporter receptor subunit TctC
MLSLSYQVLGRSLQFLAIGFCVTTLVDSAFAQEGYPSKVIQLVVTTAAGGANDIVARAVAERLSESMGRPVIIDNQPAGNGSVAAGQVARAAPDGYTLMMVVDSTLTINPHLYNNINYDVFRDFTPISIVARLPVVLLGSAELKANTVPDLVALAKREPGKLNYASTGVGTVLHVGMELFKLMTKTDIVHVPYRSTTGAMTDLLGGRIDLMLIGISAVLGQTGDSKIKVLGIGSQRSPLLPNVPTIAESGVPGYQISSWFGLLGPPNMPQPIVDRLAVELKKAATDPKFTAALEPIGMQIVDSSSDEMRAAMRTDSEKWGNVIKTLGLTVN